MLKVESSRPMPHERRGRPATYPWAKLTRKGHSFFVPLGESRCKDLESLQSSLISAARTRRVKLAVTVRINREANGVGVWRTA